MIEIRDANNKVIFDANSRPLKIIRFYDFGSSYTGGTQSGSVYVPMWAQWPNNRPVFVRLGAVFNFEGFDAVVRIEGATFYWDYPRANSEWNGSYHNARPNSSYVLGMF